MSSIVYVSDNKMIEYHRLNGNTTMNFWRLSSQKSFSDFSVGDLLFFYVKERVKQKERSIVGYGKFKEINKLNINQMWNKYGTLNGFASKDELKEAILKASKNKKIPKMMNCIFLENVIFFQNPIYLSNFGINISNKLESYFYLDKDDPKLTGKILQFASQDGIDLWSVATGSIDEDSLEDTQIIHKCSRCIERVNSLKYNAIQGKSAFKLMEELDGYKPFKEKRFEYYKLENGILNISIPFVYNLKNHDDSLKRLLGHIILLKYYLDNEEVDYKIYIVSEGNISKEDEVILKGINK